MSLLNLLFPKNCLECKRHGNYICASCLKKVSKSPYRCAYCRRYSFAGKTHSYCKKSHGLDGRVSIFVYEGVVRASIMALKYRFAKALADELGEVSVKELATLKPKLVKPTLVPIPLHKARQRLRGFNQSALIGEKVANKMDWDYVQNLLLRSKKRPQQTGLKSKERKLNIRGVFSLNGGNVHSTTYLLFDDVWTTGSTIKEAAKVLKRAGAKEVWGLTIAS